MVSKFLTKRSFKAIPDYEVLEKIDDGGMSVVYKGRSRLTGALVAIKVFKAKMAKDPTLVKRFQQEFRACRPRRYRNWTFPRHTCPGPGRRCR